MVPNGCGRWTGQFKQWTLKIEAEWKDGEVMGKAVNYYSDGEEVQWQTGNGRLCQKVIHWLGDGGHREGEKYPDPKSYYGGQLRCYDRDGTLKGQQQGYSFYIGDIK